MMFRQGAAEYNRFAPCFYDKKRYACQAGARDTRAKQERETHPQWTCYQGEISASA